MRPHVQEPRTENMRAWGDRKERARGCGSALPPLPAASSVGAGRRPSRPGVASGQRSACRAPPLSRPARAASRDMLPGGSVQRWRAAGASCKAARAAPRRRRCCRGGRCRRPEAGGQRAPSAAEGRHAGRLRALAGHLDGADLLLTHGLRGARGRVWGWAGWVKAAAGCRVWVQVCAAGGGRGGSDKAEIGRHPAVCC